MELLEKRIREEGRVLPGEILKVDSFLNHQIDVRLMDRLADEFCRLFSDGPIDRVLTVEASGIASATLVALKLGVPLVFAKKSKTKNLDGSVYSADVYSYTHGVMNQVVVSKSYLKAGERVLLIDDFLANGQASLGLASLVEQAGGTVAGIGILVEKSYQEGRALLEAKGYRVESLARVAAMDDFGGIRFVGEN